MHRIRAIIVSTAVLCLWISTASAGQFKHISIDGEMEDWLGVPVLETADPGGDGAFGFKDVALANDDDFLYVRVRLHRPGNYANFNHQVIVDTDADSGTGYGWAGIGSELFVENGASYQQKNGGFNEGGGSNLEWAVSPGGTISHFEMRISRRTLDNEGLPFFSGDEVAVSVSALSLQWAVTDSFQALSYTFASEPTPFQGSKILTDTVNTFWFYQEVGDPVVPEWLLPDYLGDDTWQGSKGFFGFGVEDGTYPANVSVPLATDRTTYYFRAAFNWENAAEGVALLADAMISDGAVFYLNGEEVRRLRMPDGAVSGETLALGGPETPGQVERLSLPAGALLVGENLIMVEVHQSADSPDSLVFGLTLSASDSIPPSLEDTSKPTDRDLVEGESTVFEIGTVAGTEPYTYQWFKDNVAIPEATERRLEIPVVLQVDAGTYAVEVSNGSGVVRSRDAILTTRALPVALADEGQPVATSVQQGEGFSLTVSVSGSPTLNYQWYKDELLIDGARGPAYMLESASLEDAGDYKVTISNRLNSITSRTVRVNVGSDVVPPTVTQLTAGSGTVTISFSEPLEENSAIDASHYTIAGIPVTGAMLVDAQTVSLTTGQLTFAQAYELTIDGVEDRFGNVLRDALAFRATIVIDGDFSDWTGIAPVTSDLQESDGAEFKEFWVANDDEYLYLRFSFHREIGQLPVDYYYQIFLDGDNDSGTGLAISSIGSSLMIENGNGWLQMGGGFNEGGISTTNFLLAPTTSSSEFECRISRASSKDGLAVFTADSVGVSFNLVSTGWEVVDSGPAEAIVYPLQPGETVVDPEPPIPSKTMRIRLVSGQVELQWQGGALESSTILSPNSWVPMPEATSPHLVPAEGPHQFYRQTD